MLKHLDLASGIGGFSLGFEWAGLSQPIMFCDTDEWCRKVLNKHWPDVPIVNDVKELANEPSQIPDHDILSAGYPCQPFSVAGRQKGKEDDRHIWPYISQIIALKRPSWVVCENVYGHIALGLDEVLLDLESQGYATKSFVIGAEGVGAPHQRRRVWIVARYVGDTKHNGSSSTEIGRSLETPSNDNAKGSNKTSEPSGASGRTDSPELAEGTGTGALGNATDDGRNRRPQTTGSGWTSDQQDRSNADLWSEPSGSGTNVANPTGTGSETRDSDRMGNDNGSSADERQLEGSSGEVTDVANADNQRSQRRLSGRTDTERQGFNGHAGRSCSAHGQPDEGSRSTEPRLGGTLSDGVSAWMDEPLDIPRIAVGVKDRTNRLKGLGNSILPQIAQRIGIAIKLTIEKEINE